MLTRTRPTRRQRRSAPRNSALNPEFLWKRLSQITGVPIETMLPKRTNRIAFGDGEYDRIIHQIAIRRRSNSKTERHEMRHAIQGLIEPKSNYDRLASRNEDALKSIPERVFDREYKFSEITNPTERGQIRDAITALPPRRQLLLLAMLPLAPILFPWRNLIISRNFKKVIERHGQDAALLVWAHPPKTEKGKLEFTFQKWEKQMVNEGYLHPHGGFTPKGLALFRTRASSAEIRRRLSEMKSVREQGKK